MFTRFKNDAACIQCYSTPPPTKLMPKRKHNCRVVAWCDQRQRKAKYKPGLRALKTQNITKIVTLALPRSSNQKLPGKSNYDLSNMNWLNAN